MKHIIPPEQRAKTLSAIIVVAAGAIMLAVLYYFNSLWGTVSRVLNLLSPFMIGFAIAFLEIPIVRRLEHLFAKTVFRRKPHPKLSRTLASFLSLILLLSIVIAFMGILLPQVVKSLKQLSASMGHYILQNSDVINSFLEQRGLSEYLTIDGNQLVIAWEQLISYLTGYGDVLLNNALAIGNTIYKTVYHIFIGIIVSVYIMLDKERLCAQAKKMCFALLTEKPCRTLIYWTRRASRVFSGFIVGKVIDSLIMGVLCYLGMLTFHLDYALLISVFVGITNIIPFFGPFIGAVPSILILLIIDPLEAFWFAVFIIVLQQIDGNILGPLILRDYVGLSSLWILVSIVVGAGLFGFLGMLLSIPTFSLIYAIICSLIESRLLKNGLPIATSAYDSEDSERNGKSVS